MSELMSPGEFQSRYHEYAADSVDEALREAAGILLTGDEAVVVELGPLGYALMLRSAAEFICGLYPSERPGAPRIVEAARGA
jgi:hypothetical protein